MTVATISSVLESPLEALPRTIQQHQADINTRLSDDDRRMHVVQKFTALGEMTGGIAHDFGNILAVVGASLRLAERSLDRPESVRRYIAAANEGLERGAELTSKLLAFAKGPDLEVQGGNANECLIKLEPLLRYSAGPQNLISLDLKQNLPNCLIDRIQFDVAILNLVNNARDAMSGRGGEIRIKTELCECEVSSYVKVRVEDQGAGMSAETLTKVFDPFFTTKGEKGNGIGLPQVRASMRLVGGYMNVTSELGRGTAVDLMFPTVNSIAKPIEVVGRLEQGA